MSWSNAQRKIKIAGRIVKYIADCISNAPDFTQEEKVERSNSAPIEIQKPTSIH